MAMPEMAVNPGVDLGRLGRELDLEFAPLINSELTELERISQFTESVTKKLSMHYARIFPKKCNTCGTIYASREAFLQATQELRKPSTVFDEAGLQEYRNCPCGSTLILLSKDRRDNTAYGIARRKLYNECLTKLRKLSTESEETIEGRLRNIFAIISS